jgi:[protein-PII] uridylyltransferase
MSQEFNEDLFSSIPAPIPNVYLPAASGLKDAEALAEFVLAERRELMKRILGSGVENPLEGEKTAHAFSDLIDAVIRRMYELACVSANADPHTMPIAVVATGGYGRRELCPFSDIDITFIPERDGESRTDRIVRELFRLLMDVFIARCELEVGYAYRLFADCNALDHQTACGLLDARFIVGSERLFIKFEDAFWLGFNAAEFIFDKISEREKILQKWGGITRVVEPQLKEGAGGLRDLQTAIWLVQASQHLPAARMRGTRGVKRLADALELGDPGEKALVTARDFLLRTRIVLHALAGAERDQLAVTRQEDTAMRLGYADIPEESVPAVELFMADLFPQMSVIRLAAKQAMRAVGRSRLMLGIGLDSCLGEIDTDPIMIGMQDPVWMVWGCELAQQYNLKYSSRFENAVRRLLAAKPITREAHQAADAFTQIIKRPGNVYPALQQMADLGILGWFLPEFASVMDLIPYDAAHDFTVGQHTLQVIKNLDDLVNAPDGSEEQAEMRRILLDLAHPEQLMLAAILHDCGKLDHCRPHSEVSAELADAVCARLEWTEDAGSQVRFLTREHLLMGETARLRDLSLDRTIREFVKQVGDAERLNMLYLLTYADTRAVGEGIWTAVKGKFLRELWHRSSAAMFDDMEEQNLEAAMADTRRRIKKDLTLQNFEASEIEEHIEAMPPYYLLNTTQQEAAMHLDFVRRVRKGETVFSFHEERAAHYTEFTISVYDDPQPGLLAKIAAALLVAQVNVHSARVLTRNTAQDRIAIDTLIVDCKDRPLSTGKKQEVLVSLRKLLEGSLTAADLVASRPVKKTGPLHQSASRTRVRGVSSDIAVTEVSTDYEAGLTMVETSAAASPDVFYRVCAAAANLGFNIQSAKLSIARDRSNVTLYINGGRAAQEAEIRRKMTSELASVHTH